jgi:hypothetical protein
MPIQALHKSRTEPAAQCHCLFWTVYSSLQNVRCVGGLDLRSRRGVIGDRQWSVVGLLHHGPAKRQSGCPPVPDRRLYDSMLLPSVHRLLSWCTRVPTFTEWNGETLAISYLLKLILGWWTEQFCSATVPGTTAKSRRRTRGSTYNVQAMNHMARLLSLRSATTRDPLARVDARDRGVSPDGGRTGEFTRWCAR